jgi:DNA-binding transcriptional ArsR family regulator
VASANETVDETAIETTTATDDPPDESLDGNSTDNASDEGKTSGSGGQVANSGPDENTSEAVDETVTGGGNGSDSTVQPTQNTTGANETWGDSGTEPETTNDDGNATNVVDESDETAENTATSAGDTIDSLEDTANETTATVANLTDEGSRTGGNSTETVESTVDETAASANSTDETDSTVMDEVEDATGTTTDAVENTADSARSTREATDSVENSTEEALQNSTAEVLVNSTEDVEEATSTVSGSVTGTANETVGESTTTVVDTTDETTDAFSGTVDGSTETLAATAGRVDDTSGTTETITVVGSVGDRARSTTGTVGTTAGDTVGFAGDTTTEAVGSTSRTADETGTRTAGATMSIIRRATTTGDDGVDGTDHVDETASSPVSDIESTTDSTPMGEIKVPGASTTVATADGIVDVRIGSTAETSRVTTRGATDRGGADSSTPSGTINGFTVTDAGDRAAGYSPTTVSDERRTPGPSQAGGADLAEAPRKRALASEVVFPPEIPDEARSGVGTASDRQRSRPGIDPGVDPVTDRGHGGIPVPDGTGGAVLAVGILALGAGAARSSGTVGGMLAGMSGDTLRLQAASALRGLRARIDRLFRIPAILGYSLYDDSDPLENDQRGQLYGAITDSPGVRLAALVDRSDASRSTVRYHLRVLEREGLVTSVTLWGNRRLYPEDDCDPEMAAALSDETSVEFLEAIGRTEPVSGSELAAELDRDDSTVTHHLTRLEDLGLVVRERDGRAIANRLAPHARQALELDDRDGQVDRGIPADD